MSTPSADIRSFAVTNPAGTLQSAPQTTLIAFPPRVVTEIHWRVPSGPAGLMGWKLTMSGGQTLLPVNGTYIVTDNHADEWLVTNQPDGGQWEVTAYNTDIYAHTVYLDFFLSLITEPSQPQQMLPNAALSVPPPTLTPAAGPGFITTPPPVTVPDLAAVPGG